MLTVEKRQVNKHGRHPISKMIKTQKLYFKFFNICRETEAQMSKLSFYNVLWPCRLVKYSSYLITSKFYLVT